MLDERFHDEINACRPGSRDLDDPEMSQLAGALAHDSALRARYDAVQRLDGRLTEAFLAVPIPAGLAARLMAGLQQAGALSRGVDSVVEQLPGSAPAAQIITLPISTARRSISRRQWLAALAASVLVATGLWTVFRSPATPAAGELTTEAAVWFERLTDHWQPIAGAPANLPLPAAIVGNPRGWQALSKSVAGRGVVYSLAQGPKARAVLFVLSAKRAGLPPSAPLGPQSTTGGLTISAWQSRGLVYVLVVEGDERAYRRFLNPGRQPLA